MIRFPRNIVAFVQLFVLAVSLSGCAALVVGAAAGAGSYVWVKGALVKEFEVPAQDLYQATKEGVSQLGLNINEDRADRISAVLAASFADGSGVKINIDALTEVRSKIRIRVGVFGDKGKSELIFNAIQKNL